MTPFPASGPKTFCRYVHGRLQHLKFGPGQQKIKEQTAETVLVNGKNKIQQRYYIYEVQPFMNTFFAPFAGV